MTTGKRADLHVRTTNSIGKLTPEEVVRVAKEKGLTAIAIVEHDTVDALPEAMAAAKAIDLEVIPSVEIVYEEEIRNAHIMGYFIDIHNKKLRSEVARAQMIRAEMVTDTLEKLQELGLKITYEDILQEAADSHTIDRLHIAKYIVEMRMEKSVREVYEKYFKHGAPAHVETEQRPLPFLMDMIQEAGGVPALAHPKFGDAEEFIPRLIREGLKGIEVYNPTHDPLDRKRFSKIAKKHNLIEVGGTDAGRGAVGDVTVSYRVVEQLKKEHENLKI